MVIRTGLQRADATRSDRGSAPQLVRTVMMESNRRKVQQNKGKYAAKTENATETNETDKASEQKQKQKQRRANEAKRSETEAKQRRNGLETR